MTRTKQSTIKKLFTFTIITLIGLSIFIGCSSSNKNSSTTKEPPIKELSEKISGSIDMSNMKIGDSARLKQFYNIDTNSLEAFSYYAPASNIKTNELLILKVKNKNDIENLKDKINQRIATESESFKDYVPEQYYLLQKHILDVKGNYIFLIVSEDAEKAENTFNQAFK